MPAWTFAGRRQLPLGLDARRSHSQAGWSTPWLTPDAVEAIRAWLLKRELLRDATLVSILAYAGLRPGEALALTWAHVRERTLLVEVAVSYKNWRRRSFRQATAGVGLAGARPYDLRHSIVSLLIAEGHNVVEVAWQAGHSPKMALDTYALVYEEFDST